MVLGLERYWWLIILAALAVCIPFKVRKRRQEKNPAPNSG